MLPPSLKFLRDSLLEERTLHSDRRRLLAELEELDEALEFPDGGAIRRLRESIESRAEVQSTSPLDHCPLCGR
jgi:hypothetical protein